MVSVCVHVCVHLHVYMCVCTSVYVCVMDERKMEGRKEGEEKRKGMKRERKGRGKKRKGEKEESDSVMALGTAHIHHILVLKILRIHTCEFNFVKQNLVQADSANK